MDRLLVPKCFPVLRSPVQTFSRIDPTLWPQAITVLAEDAQDLAI